MYTEDSIFERPYTSHITCIEMEIKVASNAKSSSWMWLYATLRLTIDLQP